MKLVYGLILTCVFVAQSACAESLSRSDALQQIQEHYAQTGKTIHYDEFEIPQAYRQGSIWSTSNALPFDTNLRDMGYITATLMAKRKQAITEGGLKGFRPLSATYWTQFNQEKFLADGHEIKSVKEVNNWKFKAYKGNRQTWSNYNTKAKIFSVKTILSHIKPAGIVMIKEQDASVDCPRQAVYDIVITWSSYGKFVYKKPRNKSIAKREACFIKTDVGWKLNM